MLLSTMLAIVVLVGCNGGWFGEPPRRAVMVNNQTSLTLRFAVQLPDELLSTGGLAGPGQTEWAIFHVQGSPEDRSLNNGCTAGELVALDPQGNEVDRHQAGLCLGETWTITGP